MKYYAAFIEANPEHPLAELARYRMGWCSMELGWKNEKQRDSYFEQAAVHFKELSEAASSDGLGDAALYCLECEMTTNLYWLGATTQSLTIEDRQKVWLSAVKSRKDFATKYPDNRFAGHALKEAAEVYFRQLCQPRQCFETLLHLLQHYSSFHRRRMKSVGWSGSTGEDYPLRERTFKFLRSVGNKLNEAYVKRKIRFGRPAPTHETTLFSEQKGDERELMYWLDWWQENKHLIPDTANRDLVYAEWNKQLLRKLPVRR